VRLNKTWQCSRISQFPRGPHNPGSYEHAAGQTANIMQATE
jgi:hypothetical protein